MSIDEIEDILKTKKENENRLYELRESFIEEFELPCIYCKMQFPPETLDVRLKLWYETPHGCMGGDNYHVSDEIYFECPDCGVINRCLFTDLGSYGESRIKGYREVMRHLAKRFNSVKTLNPKNNHGYYGSLYSFPSVNNLTFLNPNIIKMFAGDDLIHDIDHLEINPGSIKGHRVSDIEINQEYDFYSLETE